MRPFRDALVAEIVSQLETENRMIAEQIADQVLNGGELEGTVELELSYNLEVNLSS